MKKIAALTGGDFKNIVRDPLYLMVMAIPLFMSAAVRFAAPMAQRLLIKYFDLSEHYLFIMSFFILWAPLMFGWIIGFILLDERDEDILSFISVTPLSKAGYLRYRILSPVLISFFLSLAVLFLVGLAELKFIKLVPVALLASLEAPLMALFLAAFAGNKVEGLALAKTASIAMLAPFAGYFLSSKWQLLAGIFPPYWVSKAFLAAYGSGPAYWLYLTGGFIIHALLIYLLLRKFKNRMG